MNDEGTRLGTLTAPAGVRLRDIGPDWVLGVAENTDGGQRVVRYGLTRR